MTEEKRTNTVSRAEFYSIVAQLFLFPAMLFLVSGGFPDTLVRQIITGLLFITMIGMSVTYSIMAMKEIGRQASGKEKASEVNPR